MEPTGTLPLEPFSSPCLLKSGSQWTWLSDAGIPNFTGPSQRTGPGMQLIKHNKHLVGEACLEGGGAVVMMVNVQLS